MFDIHDVSADDSTPVFRQFYWLYWQMFYYALFKICGCITDRILKLMNTWMVR